VDPSGQRNMASIFISHISEESALATLLKNRIEGDFLGLVTVFVASDGASISAGSDWLESVRDGLDKASLQIVLCSATSVQQPWVNFEAGAAWLKGVPIVPLCHSGFNPEQLPMPLLILQGGSVSRPETFSSLYARLADLAKSRVPHIDFAELARAASAVVMVPLLIQKPKTEPEHTYRTADKLYVPPILQKPLQARYAELTAKMIDILRFIRNESRDGDRVEQQVIERHFKDLGGPSEIFYRLEVLHLLGLIEKSPLRRNEHGEWLYQYRLSQTFREEVLRINEISGSR
jgi:TIR domain